MNHVKLAFWILAAVILISGGSEYIVSQKQNELSEILYDLKNAAETNDKEASERLCKEAVEKWEDAEPLFSYILPLDKVNQAEQSIYSLQPLCEMDSDELAAEAASAQLLCSRLD